MALLSRKVLKLLIEKVLLTTMSGREGWAHLKDSPCTRGLFVYDMFFSLGETVVILHVVWFQMMMSPIYLINHCVFNFAFRYAKKQRELDFPFLTASFLAAASLFLPKSKRKQKVTFFGTKNGGW